MTMSEALVAFGGLVTALTLAWGAVKLYFDARQASRQSTSDNWMALAQDLQGRVVKLEHRMDASVARERVLSDYTMLLRKHIADGLPPPPPPWPAELLHANYD
jgi:hypothetical protein